MINMNNLVHYCIAASTLAYIVGCAVAAPRGDIYPELKGIFSESGELSDTFLKFMEELARKCPDSSGCPVQEERDMVDIGENIHEDQPSPRPPGTRSEEELEEMSKNIRYRRPAKRKPSSSTPGKRSSPRPTVTVCKDVTVFETAPMALGNGLEEISGTLRLKRPPLRVITTCKEVSEKMPSLVPPRIGRIAEEALEEVSENVSQGRLHSRPTGIRSEADQEDYGDLFNDRRWPGGLGRSEVPQEETRYPVNKAIE